MITTDAPSESLHCGQISSVWSITPKPVLPARSRKHRLLGGEIRNTKTLNLSRNIVSLQVLGDVSRSSPCVINLSRNKNIFCGLKKFVAKSRARVNFEQHILALLLVFHHSANLLKLRDKLRCFVSRISPPLLVRECEYDNHCWGNSTGHKTSTNRTLDDGR